MTWHKLPHGPIIKFPHEPQPTHRMFRVRTRATVLTVSQMSTAKLTGNLCSLAGTLTVDCMTIMSAIGPSCLGCGMIINLREISSIFCPFFFFGGAPSKKADLFGCLFGSVAQSEPTSDLSSLGISRFFGQVRPWFFWVVPLCTLFIYFLLEGCTPKSGQNHALSSSFSWPLAMLSHSSGLILGAY